MIDDINGERPHLERYLCPSCLRGMVLRSAAAVDTNKTLLVWRCEEHGEKMYVMPVEASRLIVNTSLFSPPEAQPLPLPPDHPGHDGDRDAEDAPVDPVRDGFERIAMEQALRYDTLDTPGDRGSTITQIVSPEPVDTRMPIILFTEDTLNPIKNNHAIWIYLWRGERVVVLVNYNNPLTPQALMDVIGKDAYPLEGLMQILTTQHGYRENKDMPVLEVLYTHVLRYMTEVRR